MEQVITVDRFNYLNNLNPNQRIYLIAKVVDIIDVSLYAPQYSPRTNVSITDGYRTMAFYIWKSLDEVSLTLSLDEVFQFSGTVQRFHGQATFKYISAMLLPEAHLKKKYNPLAFRGLLQDTKVYFIESLKRIQDFRYRRLVEVCYGLGKRPEGVTKELYHRRFDVQFNGCGSINRHDSYAGGYINHLSGMLRIAEQLEAIYGNRERGPIGRVEKMCAVNWDVVRTLVYLHDLGKQSTYTLTPNRRVVYKQGTKLDHADFSMLMVSQHLREVEPELALDYDEEQSLLSGIQHHGAADFNKPVEDQILSQLDILDSCLVDNLEFK